MAMYLIGDVQGCDEPLQRLLDALAFSPSRDRLVVLGDVVNRGPASLATLRRLMALGDSAQALLGNHDLHLLAVGHGVRSPHRSDTLGDVLAAPDARALLDWLRQRPMALRHDEPGQPTVLMVHAGVLPQWDVATVMALVAEVESVLRSDALAAFLPHMYGNTPARWSDALRGDDRLRVIVNALTRLRFCTPAEGEMEFVTKDGSGQGPAGYVPWFDVPGRRTAQAVVAFGHWSTLGLLARRDLISLDTGCVWGGCLSAMRIDGGRRELVQVPCPQAQVPG